MLFKLTEDLTWFQIESYTIFPVFSIVLTE